MAENNKVVAHFGDGRLLKGSTQNFLPGRAVFHLLPASGGGPVEVRSQELKALFFVRDLVGNPQRRDLRGFLAAPGETPHGRKVAVRFKDGEFLCGYSLAYQPGREAFFVFPADAAGNNLRIFVVAAATVEVKVGPAADVLVRQLLTRISA